MADKKKKGIWGTDFIEDLVRLHTDGILTKEEVHREMNKILWPHYDRTIHAEKPPEHMSPIEIRPGKFEPDPPGTRAAMGGEWNYQPYERLIPSPDEEFGGYDEEVEALRAELEEFRKKEREGVDILFEDADYAERAGKHGYEIEYGPTPKQGTATFVRHGDKKIYFDPEMAEEKYTTKAWETPRVEGVNPIEGEHFPNKEKWYKFLHEHELAHLSNKRKEGESKADYENRINQIALDALLEGVADEEISGGAGDLGGLLSFLADKGSGVVGRLLGGVGMAAYPSSSALDPYEDVALMRQMNDELLRRRR